MGGPAGARAAGGGAHLLRHRALELVGGGFQALGGQVPRDSPVVVEPPFSARPCLHMSESAPVCEAVRAVFYSEGAFLSVCRKLRCGAPIRWIWSAGRPPGVAPDPDRRPRSAQVHRPRTPVLGIRHRCTGSSAVILDLAAEAQVKRWMLTHKYPNKLMAKYQAEFKAARHKSEPVKKAEVEVARLRKDLAEARKEKRKLTELAGTYAIMIDQLTRERAEAIAERDEALAARDAALGLTPLAHHAAAAAVCPASWRTPTPSAPAGAAVGSARAGSTCPVPRGPVRRMDPTVVAARADTVGTWCLPPWTSYAPPSPCSARQEVRSSPP